MLNDSKLTQRQIKDFETEINQQIETLNETTRDEIEKLRIQMKVCPCQLPVIEATNQFPERTFIHVLSTWYHLQTPTLN